MADLQWYSGRASMGAVLSTSWRRAPEPSLVPLRIALIYVLVAGLWILFSDRAVDLFFGASPGAIWIQTAKGWIFVAGTAVWLHYLLRREHGLRRRVEETERAAAEMLGAFIGSAPIAIVGIDREEKVTLWNRAAEGLFGWSATEALGNVVPFVPAELVEESHRLHELTMNGERLEGIELTRCRKDGSPIEVALWTAPVHTRSGRVSGAVIAINDLSGARRAQAERRKQMERLASLREVDQAVTGSLDLDLTLSVVLDQAIRQLSVDAAAVLLLNPAGQVLEPARGRGFRRPLSSRTRIRLGDGIAGAVAFERRTVHIESIERSQIAATRRSWFLEEGVVSYTATPLLAKGRVRGVLEVFTRSAHRPDHDWLDFFETLAGQTAIAIDNTTLFEDLQRANARLMIAYDETLEGWSGALELRDEETEGHSRRVTEASVRLAQALGIGGKELINLRWGALLHDIGKMGIPDSILLKPGPLTEDEWEVMRQHPVYAYELLSSIEYLRPALDIPYCHHERWDGTGYPRGIAGAEIPIAARIFAIIDVWDALLSDRPYRPRLEPEEVLAYIESQAGSHFDPGIVREFLRMESQLRELQEV